jgi:hypothetical protein
MAPLAYRARRHFAYLSVWLIGGLALAGLLVDAALAPWVVALVFALPMAVSLGFVCASARYVSRGVVLTQRAGLSTVLVFVAASVVAGAMWTLFCLVWSAAGAALLILAGADVVDSAPFVYAASGSLVMLPQRGLLLLMLLGGGAYLIALLMHDIGRAAEQLRDAQTREDQSRLQARDAQLQMLRTQISPHFLFNSLNSISALTSHNAAAARDMTLELAAFFRKTLALAEQERIALSQEIALCQHFLAVEKIRFGDKLRVAMDVSQAAGSVLIPPMLLQPCVENAIKHGVRHLPDGGCVTLRAFVQEPWLYVTIENPVDPDALAYADVEMAEGRGVGLANIRQRLSTVYGGQARIAWDLQQQRFSIEMVLPAQVPP